MQLCHSKCSFINLILLLVLGRIFEKWLVHVFYCFRWKLSQWTAMSAPSTLQCFHTWQWSCWALASSLWHGSLCILLKQWMSDIGVSGININRYAIEYSLICECDFIALWFCWVHKESWSVIEKHHMDTAETWIAYSKLLIQ